MNEDDVIMQRKVTINNEEFSSYEACFEIWLHNESEEGLISDFYNLSADYDTLEECLNCVEKIPKECFDKFNVTIEFCFSVFDTETEGYYSSQYPLLLVNSNMTYQDIHDELY